MWIRSKNKEVLVNVSEFNALPNIGEDTYTVYGYVDRSSTIEKYLGSKES